MREHPFFKVGGTPAKVEEQFCFVHFLVLTTLVFANLAASPNSDADWPRWLQCSARGPSRASRRDGENFETPFFFVVRFHGNGNNRPQRTRWFQVYFTSPQIDGSPAAS